MMMGFHIAYELDEILFGYICAKYKIVGINFLLPILEESVCHIVAVKCTILYVPTYFLQTSLNSYFNLASNFKPNISTDRIFPLAWFALAPYKMNINFLS